jgi:hypothetical protein
MGIRHLFARGVSGILCAIATLSQAGADPLPTRIGQCSQTTISRIGTRLDDVAGSGSALQFANQGYQVSYETVPQIGRSRVGDPVTVCLVSIPTLCPPGDDRGRIYKTTNLRTRESWQLPDSPHSCGGA